MSTWRKVGCCLIAAVAAFGSFADGEEPVEPEIREGQLWTYDASTRKLTEIVEEGVTPWVIHIDASGAIDSTSVGANPVVDLRKATFPDGVPDILTINHGQNIFRERKTLETIYLPDTCTQLKSHTFYYSSKLANVYFPQNPGGNFSAGADSSGGTFRGTVVREAVLPRTMKTVSGYMFRGVWTLQRVELPDDVTTMDNTAFMECSGIKEVVWHNWVTNVMNKTVSPFPGVGNLTCRHIVPGNNPDWARFYWDPAKVTPWAKCTEKERSDYFTRYGEDATEPFGISTSGAAGFNRGYIVTDGTSCGVPFSATVADARTGSVTVDPAPADGGFYPEGTQVRVTFTPNEGYAFVRWEGTTDGIDATSLEITVTMNQMISLVAVSIAPTYVRDGNSLSDGVTKLSCTGEDDAIVITGGVSVPSTLDLTKPVTGGTITGIGASAFSSTKGMTQVVLPATLAEIGATAFPNSVKEIVWNGAPAAWAASSFSALTAKKARFVVPEGDKGWAEIVCDATKVTQWSSLAVADKDAYFAAFGTDAAQPAGLGVGGGVSGVWIVHQKATGGISVADVPRQFAGARPTPAVTAEGAAIADVSYEYVGGDAAGPAAVVATVTAGDHAGEAVVAYYTVATVSHSDTYTWKTCADGEWENAANWQSASGDAGYPQMPGDEVVLPKFQSDTSYAVTASYPFWVKSLTIGDVSGGTLGSCTAKLIVSNGQDADHVEEDLVVKQGGILAQAGNAATQNRNLYFKVGGDVVVEEGGVISASGAGFSAKGGTGGTGTMCTGAAYAGWGYGNSKKPYGSILRPTDWGSSTCSTSGGGAIRLDVAGDVTVDGVIEANGSDSKDANYASCGGSVWIECETISGSGTVEAKEASRSGTQSRADCNSSGGRIAVYQRTGTDFTAFPASRFVTSRTGNNAAGTVYLESAETRDLYIQGGPNSSVQRTVFPMPDDGEDLSQYADLSIHVVGNAHLGVCDLHPGAAVTVRSVELTGNSLMTVAAGAVLRVVEELDVTGAKSVTGGGFEFVGAATATFLGASRITSFEGVVCTNAGKTIRFGTAAADKLTVGAGKDLVLKGTEEAPVNLRSAEDGVAWQLALNANPGVIDILHVTVKDSDASTGAPVLAISSENVANNTNWGFSNPIEPGETITWTGAKDGKWDAAENWNPSRAPIETDAVVIPAGAANYPTLPSGTYLFNTISVASGAAFTLSGGCLLTVTNALTVAGSLAFTGAEELYLPGDANFTGGTVTKASGKIHLTGTADQTVDFGGTSLFKVYCEKPSGDVSFGAHGFAADAFTCAASTPITFTFAAGATYTVPALALSSVGADRQITLASSVPGTAWKLVTSVTDQSVSGVEAHDCDASEGATVMAGTKSVAADNCTNWDTVTSIAAWLGGSGDWTNPAKWSTGAVPGETESVTVSAADGETLTVTVPADAAAHVKNLTVLAGTGGKATFVANGALTVEGDVEIRANGVIELNRFDDAGDAPNVVKGDFVIRSGGVLSHTGPNDTEARKLHLMVLGDMTVDEGGTVDVERKGYTVNHGPGYVRCGPMHGATATKYCNNGSWTAAKHCYGSIRRPVSYGSGSGGNAGVGEGGGVANLQVAGNLVLNGAIKASGVKSSSFPGAGGSVFIRCGALSGSGPISAAGEKSSGDGGCVSSGGRIAIHQSGATDLSAFTGKVTTMYAGDYNSACGTIYYEFAGDPANEGTLVVDNGGYSRGRNQSWDGDVYPHTVFGAFVEDVGIPFGEIVVTNKGSLMVDAGIPIRVTRKLAVSSNSEILSSVIDFTGADEAVFVGAGRCAIDALVCTNAGKTVRIGTGTNDKPVIAAGKSFVICGDAEHPVSLLPLDGEAKWQIDVDANASVDVRCVAVSNSTSVSASINAVNSHDLGGNEKWAFIAEIVPGEEIVWTGAKSTDWMDPQNWDRGRNPVVTDTILVNALGDTGNYPTLGSGIFAFEQITVASGASFTLDGCDLTISNKLTVAGTLVFAGAERLRLVRDADFTGGQVVKGGSTVSLEGEDAQIVDFAGCALRYLNIAKNGGTVAFTGGFAADILRCCPSGALALEFSDGVAIRANDLYLNAVGTPLTLAGNGWNLWATEDRQAVANVKVSGCTATGATIYAGKSSTDEGGNSGWDFDTATGVWLGGSGSWTDTSHWAGGQVPTAAVRVKLAVGENEKVTITVPANNAVEVKALTLSGNAGGCATVVANSPMTFESVDLCENGVLELNCYDDDGEAPNVVSGDVRVRNGGRITHTGPANAENAKVHLKVLGGVTVEEGGSIDANAKGYAKAKGPGSTGDQCKGAAHAGWGYNNVAQPYGSAFRPVTWGSGNSGAPGGGAVHLVVAGTLTVDGCVSAEGGASSPYAGAGGSVWLECARLVGSGVLSVTEGRRDTAIRYNIEDCTSSGGRIAVYQTAAKDFSAFPVSQMHTSWLGYNAAGTIWLQSVDPMSFCELHVELGNWAIYDTTRKTELVTADDLARMDAYRHVKIFVTGVPYASVSYDVTVRDLVLRASDAAGKKVPHLELNGKTLKIRSMKHVNGRKWFKGYEAAIESGHVVLGGTALNPGKIEWIGGATGMMLMVK